MKLVIFTLALNGEPWIEKHLPIFDQLKCDWKWIIIHGAAMNNHSTSWCQPQKPNLSWDGTSKYLDSIAIKYHQRLKLIEQARWESKDVMCNTALMEIHDECVLVQIDSDEIWRPEQITKIVEAFEKDNALGSIMFRCNYFVGPNIVVKSNGGFGDRDYEWRRAWRFTPGMKFKSHEPPILEGSVGWEMSKDESERLIGRFDHFAYATEQQVRQKEAFYGYSGLVNQWRALQANQVWPCKLGRFFPIAEPFVECERR